MSQSATRLEVVVTFLAVLELYKMGEIEVLQDGTFADIFLIPSVRQAPDMQSEPGWRYREQCRVSLTSNRLTQRGRNCSSCARNCA